MTQSVTESSISPGPLSPFSTYSVASGVTSDDAPDLGAFNDVFRALTNLHPLVRTGGEDTRNATPASSFAPSQSDSDPLQGPSQWSHRRAISNRIFSAPGSPFRGRSLLAPEDSTQSEYDDGTEQEVPIEDVVTLDRPSLGLLDETLTYIAAEREKLAARRDLRGNGSTTSDSASQLLVPPARKKRRRKRTRSARRATDNAHGETTKDGPDGVDEVSADNEDGESSSSSLDPSSPSVYYKTVPTTPAVFRKEKQKQRTILEHNPRLHHSRSVPSLGLHASNVITTSFDAQTIQLRNLAHKLRLLFSSEAKALSTILSRNFTSAGTYADPRGPAPQPRDTLIHVFIDHSNILIGFITHVKKHLQHVVRKYKQTHLSHAALSLVLERGRPVTRRVLVTSSPLYQPMDSAESLGYEVRIYARVPDTGDGTDRQHNHNAGGHSRTNSRTQNGTTVVVADAGARHRPRQPYRGHSQRASVGGGAGTGTGTSTESDQGNNGGSSATRTRYREQGVDELLQLKLHQAIVDVDVVPPGGTIVLATGDGNVGQFNEDGFLGCVRTALKKGWRVELYAWEGGLSRAWSREFGDNERFRIVMLDRYAFDLLEMPESAGGGGGH